MTETLNVQAKISEIAQKHGMEISPAIVTEITKFHATTTLTQLRMYHNTMIQERDEGTAVIDSNLTTIAQEFSPGGIATLDLLVAVFLFPDLPLSELVKQIANAGESMLEIYQETEPEIASGIDPSVAQALIALADQYTPPQKGN